MDCWDLNRQPLVSHANALPLALISEGTNYRLNVIDEEVNVYSAGMNINT